MAPLTKEKLDALLAVADETLATARRLRDEIYRQQQAAMQSALQRDAERERPRERRRKPR